MTENRFNLKLDKIKEENKEKEYKQLLKDEKKKVKKAHQKIQVTKMIILYLMMLLNAIIIYACIAMWHFKDLTYLQALITDIAAQVLVFAIYCAKSYFETKQEELTKIEKEKLCKMLLEENENK